jgi:hypothetical protein
MGLQIIYVTPLVVNQGMFLRLSRTYCEVDMDAEHSTMIAWVLDDRGTGVRFVRKSDNKGEAFAWNDPKVPTTVFDMKATVADDGDLMWLFDRHKDQVSKTSQSYTLSVLWNGTVYKTSDDPTRQKDPVIINR